MTPETPLWPPGFRINPRAAGPPSALIEAYRGVPVAAASDNLGRVVGSVGLLAYHGDVAVTACGPAVTVRVRPGDNLMIHKALLMCEPGDVLVVDAGGSINQAVMGGLMRTTAIARRLAAVVVDGAVRDVAEWAEGGLPVWAKGHTHRGPGKEGPGEVNVAIACAGMAVHPGDLILGDADGVLAIPVAEVEALLPKIQSQLEKERKVREASAKGVFDAGRFDAQLRAKGVPV
jgi:regulator of RNase E activity RraA